MPGASPSGITPPAPPPATGWSAFKLGGGGITTKVDVANDGTWIIGVDSANAWLRLPNAPNPGNAGGLGSWLPITGANNLPASYITALINGTTLAQEFPNAGGAVYDIRVAPSNSNIAYMLFDGFLFRTLNLKAANGPSWTQLNGASQWNRGVQDTASRSGNNQARTNGHYMAIDPLNPDVVFVTSFSSGVQFTTNGTTSATFTTIPTTAGGIPAALGTDLTQDGLGVYAVMFDNAVVSGGNTVGLVVLSWGNGVYHTSDYTAGGSGGTWTLQSSSITEFSGNYCCDDIGHMCIIDVTSQPTAPGFGNIWHKPPTGGPGGSTWTKVFTSGSTTPQSGLNGVFPSSVCCGLSGSGIMYAQNLANQENYLVSTNHGASWFGAGNVVTLSASDVPWLLGAGGVGFYTAGNAVVDPTTGNILIGASFAFIIFNPPQDGTSAFTVTSVCAGMESATCVSLEYCEGSRNLITALEDHPNYTKADNTNTFPSTYNPFLVDTQGWCINSHGNTVGVLITRGTDGLDHTGSSTDGGNNFNAFTHFVPGLPTDGSHGAYNGNISCGGQQNFVVVRQPNGTNPINVYYTLNAATSAWLTGTFNGNNVPSTIGASDGWISPISGFVREKVICSDRVTDNKHYAYNYGGNLQSTGYSYNSGTGVLTLTMPAGTGRQVGDIISISSLPGTNSAPLLNNDFGNSHTYTCIAGTNDTTIVVNTGQTLAGTTVGDVSAAISSASYTSSSGQLQLTFASAPLGASAGSNFNPGVHGDYFVTVTGMTPASLNGTHLLLSTASAGTVITVQATAGLGSLSPSGGTFATTDAFVRLYSDGIWVTTDGGANWSIANNTTMRELGGSATTWLDAVPGHAGHLFFTNGSYPSAAGVLMHSQDAGVTWVTLTGTPALTDVYAFAVGKQAAVGGTYPAIVVIGRVGGVWGIWRSIDHGLTWQAYGPDQYPGNNLDTVISLTGDPNVEGHFWAVLSGSGILEGQF